MVMREAVDPVCSTPPTEAVGGASASLRAQPPSVLRVLTYHRVDSLTATPELHSSTLSATVESFAGQARMLARWFRVLSLDEVLEMQQANRPLPPRSVLITFDDACRCFAEQAWPVLRRHQLPVTLFVPTAFPGGDHEFWWDTIHRLIQHASCQNRSIDSPIDRLPTDTEETRRASFRRLADWYAETPNEKAVAWLGEACESLDLPVRPSPVLTWDELRGLADKRLSLAAHSRRHQPLTALTTEQLTDEVEGSLADLQREVGKIAPVFAYPGGYVDERVRSHVQATGVRLAFGTRRGGNRMDHCDPYLLRRINVGRRSSPARIWTQLMLPVSWLNRIGDYE